MYSTNKLNNFPPQGRWPKAAVLETLSFRQTKSRGCWENPDITHREKRKRGGAVVSKWVPSLLNIISVPPLCAGVLIHARFPPSL